MRINVYSQELTKEVTHVTKTADTGIAYALKGLLHVQLWYAKQARTQQQAHAEWARKQREAQAAMPPPAPPMPAYYPGAF